MLNRLAGSADEMVNSIKETLERFTELNQEKQESKNTIEKLRQEISNLNLKEPQSKSLLNLVSNIERQQGDAMFPAAIRFQQVLEQARAVDSDLITKAIDRMGSIAFTGSRNK